MFIIYRNIRDTLKRRRGLFKIKYIKWEGLFAKRKIGRAFLEKRVIKGGGSLVNRGKGRGFWAKHTSFFYPPMGQNRGGAQGAGSHGLAALGAWWRPE